MLNIAAPEYVDPFDLVSGKVVQNECGTFWFKEPGNNMQENGWPIRENLHRDNDLPAIIWKSGSTAWYKDGKRHRVNGPAIIVNNNLKSWWLNDTTYTVYGYFLALESLKE